MNILSDKLAEEEDDENEEYGNKTEFHI